MSSDKSIAELAHLVGLRYRVNHIPQWKVPLLVKAPNRPGTGRAGSFPRKLCVHGTANFKLGATAAMHEQFVRAPNWGGKDKTSYHAVVDDVEAIELLPWEEVAYHGGTPESNEFWWAAEICENDGHYGNNTLINAAKLFACAAVKSYMSPVLIDKWLVQHNAAYGKDCPYRLRHTEGAWDAFVAAIELYVRELKELVVEEIELNGFVVRGPILRAFKESNGIAINGLPISNEMEMEFPAIGKLRVQWFERARLELQPNGTVTRGLVGAEALASLDAPKQGGNDG